MTSRLVALQLEHAAQRLADRLGQLEARLQDSDVAAWSEYATVTASLAAILPALAPDPHGDLMTTAEMASRLGIAPKTLLKRRAKGLVGQPVVLGKRGRAALRWKGSEVPR